MEKQFFTIQEARQALPAVKELMGKAILCARQMTQYKDEVEQLAGRSEQNTGSAEGTDYIFHLLALKRHLARIEEMGVLVKSVEEGLVDFPHLKDGREVYLCWKYGEEDIDYYHEVDAGFAGRTPIEE